MFTNIKKSNKIFWQTEPETQLHTARPKVNATRPNRTGNNQGSATKFSQIIYWDQ